MKVLYENEDLEVYVRIQKGFIVKDESEEINEAVDCYGPDFETYEGALESSLKDSSRPTPEIYEVEVTYRDGKIQQILGKQIKS